MKEIIKMPLNVHISKLPNRKIKYIAIHYTAGGSSKDGTAKGIKKVFETREASADFAVDDNNIVQFNPDINNYYCWAVGDKKNIYNTGGELYGVASNRNTISIEMCSNLRKGASASVPNHNGWYFTEETINNTIELVRYLMKKFNIDKNNVVMHNTISAKCCPGVPNWTKCRIYDENGNKTSKHGDGSEWVKFLSKI